MARRPLTRDTRIRCACRAVMWALLGLIFAVTLSFGGTEAFGRSIALVFTGGLLLCMAAGFARDVLTFPALRVGWVVVCLALWVMAWAFFQTTSLTPQEFWNPAWGQLSRYLDHPVQGSIAVRPLQARAELIWYGLYASAFAAAFIAARSRSAVRDCIIGFLLIQVIGVVMALVLMAVPLDSALGIYSRGYPGSLSSTFINRNSYAGFLGMGLSVCVAALVYVTQDQEEAVINYRGLSMSRNQLLCAGIALFFILALVMTKSRAGMGAALMGAGAALLVWKRPALSPRNLSIMAVAVFFVLALISATEVMQRFQPGELDESLGARLRLMQLSWRIFEAFPLQGVGLTGFADMASSFLTIDEINRRVLVSAHNTYLEVLVELGLIGAIPVFLITGALCLYAVRGLSDPHDRPIAIACVGIIVQMALHSLVDFSMEIPAIVLSFCVILGTACGQRAMLMQRKSARIRFGHRQRATAAGS